MYSFITCLNDVIFIIVRLIAQPNDEDTQNVHNLLVQVSVISKVKFQSM